MKKLLPIWIIIVVGIFSCLTIFGFKYKKVSKYIKLEESLKESGKRYMGEHVGEYPEKGKQITLDITKLNSYLVEDFEIDGKACSGYVEVSSSYGYKYKAFIKCDNYITKNYKIN